jgi:hypothetical protein
MHALLVAAAEGGEESSKGLFYFAGGLLAIWAVALGAYGLSRPDFPSDGAARGIMGVSALLVLAAVAASIVTG